ncbi:MAG TPA: hypothetical protein VES64_04480 [Allosphingosinicella sp.]|nr:hypothetical protein [Allosphingosinicella sp.]
MAIMTFTNNVCVNLTDFDIAVLPPSVGDVLDPNQVAVYNGASDEAIISPLGVFTWVNNMVVPGGYACMWTFASPDEAMMMCLSTADDKSQRLVINAKATGKKGKLPPKKKPAKKQLRPARQGRPMARQT